MNGVGVVSGGGFISNEMAYGNDITIYLIMMAQVFAVMWVQQQR
jgi:hypothetical protein